VLTSKVSIFRVSGASKTLKEREKEWSELPEPVPERVLNLSVSAGFPPGNRCFLVLLAPAPAPALREIAGI
jgi:hypothetical protein